MIFQFVKNALNEIKKPSHLQLSVYKIKHYEYLQLSVDSQQTEGKARLHPYHLGTQEPLAREIVAEIYENRAKHGQPVVTVALMRAGKIVDVYHGRGEWSSTLGELGLLPKFL